MKPGSFYIPSQGIIFRFILQVNEDMFMLINALSLLVMNSQEKQFKEGFIVAYLFFGVSEHNSIDRNGVTKLSSFLHEKKGERCGIRKNEGR